MGLDDRRFFVGRGFLLGFAQFLDQPHGLAFQTALETSTCAGMDEFDKVIIGQVKELFEFDATVGEGAERPLLLELGGKSGVGNRCVGLAHDRPSSRGEWNCGKSGENCQRSGLQGGCKLICTMFYYLVVYERWREKG
jgi:hypothetical protein